VSVYHLFIEVIVIINKKLLIHFVVGTLLMDLRNKHLINDTITFVLVAEMKQSQRLSLSNPTAIVDDMSNDLQQITKQLGSAHKKKSEGEKELKASRTQFFEAIDQEILSTQTLAQQTIPVPEVAVDQEALIHYVAVFYPGWQLGEVVPSVWADGLPLEIIIEENPAFKKFVYVNSEDGNFYRRNVSQAGPSLDDERLKKEDPRLWHRITEEKVERVLKDIDTLPDKDLAAMQEYFVPGSMTVKLDAPRKAKPDELDT
jgi:hypothetical protein